MKNNWKNLQDLLFFQEGPGVRKNQFRNNGIKLLNVGNINNKKLNLDTTSIFITEEEAYGKYSHFLVEDGDLLICCSGIVVDNFHNKIVFAEEKHLPLCLNTSTMRFRTLNNDILNIKFFYYFLMTRLFKEQLQKLITGSAQLNFGPSHIKKISMPIIEMNKQKQIAKTLDKANELIELRKESIIKLDALAKSIFIDMFGDPLSKDIKNFELLGNLANIVMGQSPNGDSYNDKGLGEPLLNGPTEFGKKYPKEKQYTTNPKKFSKHGDILFCVRGATAGKLNYSDKKYCIGRGLASISSKSKYSNSYLFYLLDYHYDYFQKNSNGSTFINICKDDLFNLKVPISNEDIQNKFAKIIEKIEEQKSLYEKELEKLEENFQALLQKSFQE
ncbi:restriction endonuclease subunit S [Aliarcobacter butzleri]|uniref:restriction endonuclease subunit S n=1 Tax=Aliarcobacter butzleri TaxID=28197 RepID=UPI001EDA138B|nr:restriction endonuclease subunit S [Aliarcobacter butzleri]MCG3706294.1 restriction endonuclease subunit S [Aliarcobacter butzleri]